MLKTKQFSYLETILITSILILVASIYDVVLRGKNIAIIDILRKFLLYKMWNWHAMYAYKCLSIISFRLICYMRGWSLYIHLLSIYCKSALRVHLFFFADLRDNPRLRKLLIRTREKGLLQYQYVTASVPYTSVDREKI
jgi:hypothetical protein